jgi:hypothetical protein
MVKYPEASSCVGFNIEVINTDQLNQFLRI